MNNGKVKIGMTQFACVPDRAANLAKAEAQIREMTKRGAKVICTQELFADRYFAQIVDYRCYDFAEPADGPLYITGIVGTAHSLQNSPASGLYRKMKVGPDSFICQHTEQRTETFRFQRREA